MSDREENCLDLSFPAVDAHASQGIETLSTRLRTHGLPTDKADDIRIAVTEAINNVVEHAYAGVVPTEIMVSCRLCKKMLDVSISDKGNPMPDAGVPDGTPATVETELADLPEGGFGWFLIRKLTSEVQYQRVEGTNTLRLRFVFADMK